MPEDYEAKEGVALIVLFQNLVLVVQSLIAFLSAA